MGQTDLGSHSTKHRSPGFRLCLQHHPSTLNKRTLRKLFLPCFLPLRVEIAVPKRGWEKCDSLMMLFVKPSCSYTKLREDLRKKRLPRQHLEDAGLMWDVYLRVQQMRNEPTAGTAAAPGSGQCPSSAPLSCVPLQQPHSGAEVCTAGF